jgi:L-rhamnose mutarotase
MFGSRKQDPSLLIARKCNERLNEFVGELIELYPEDSYFRSFRTGLNALTMGAPRKPIQILAECIIGPYSTFIAERNADFFLNKSYADELQESTVLDLIPLLKKHWSTMSPDVQATMWDYCDSFVSMVDAYNKVVAPS